MPRTYGGFQPFKAAVKSTYFPEVRVVFAERDGATDIVTKTAVALSRHGLPDTVVDGYVEDATAHDLDHMWRTTLQWVEPREEL